jgi:hypothetical protein
LSARYYVSTKVNKDTQRQLASGDIKGEPSKSEEQFPKGTTARKADGQRVFYPRAYLELLKLRNRGKD